MTRTPPATPARLLRRDLPRPSIPDIFRQVCAAMPDRSALLHAGGRMSYAELARRSDLIAAGLQRRGIGRGSLVGLFMPRSANAIVAILGVLKAGAAYLPFDPAYPARLLRYIHDESAVALMLVDLSQADAGGEPPFWNAEALDVDTMLGAAFPTGDSVLMPPVTAEDLAYVMYTSGSTGRPKGVLIPHRGVVRLVVGNPFVDLDSSEVLLQLAPLSFDASTFEIWGALLNGGTLALPSATCSSLDDIAQAIAQFGVTTLWLTAGIFHLMVDHRLDALRPLRQLLAGGDVLSPPHVARAVRALPQTRLINGYGPTENTTFTCCYTVPRDFSPEHAVPIGRAIADTEIYVVDAAGQLALGGADGELYVGGAGLARGYINRDELTAERFVPNPFDATPGARLYRTGDRVRIAGDGQLHFLGRVDRQIKINGKRVELDEIEACLRRSELVGDAAAVGFKLAGQQRVAAFVTPAAGAATSIAALRGFLLQELPDYMQPATLSLVAALPLSPAGKVDRAQLPLPDQAPAPPLAPIGAMGQIESTLLNIWHQALGTGVIGLTDNFFDLGGTSLQMIQVHAHIQASLKHDAMLVDLFRYPNIGALAAWIKGGTAAPLSRTSAQQRAALQREALARARSLH